ncbi:PAS domain-containing sensor histidine kinase [Paraburkholderia kururiensis]|uniref:histidine kinase n=1 Tax=Paraburkholderia kururiensis TaxID=984307 RepID=A0ABZ0WPZ6_9BURK|nr:PAS domain-containing sensor histidine kinase [Paraburkholderia kururiensis]WQD79485.1 PAS domain-containing sensor histidine kinase [Paraburkholderia kururiensis]
MSPTNKASASDDPVAKAARVPVDERYRILVETVREYAIFLLAPDGTVATWNPGAQRIKGYRAEEIVGRHFSVFYPEEDVAAGKCEHELRTAATEGSVEDEGWRVRRDGSRFWANVLITAVRSPSGELLGFAKVTRDMTERRRLEELEHARLIAARIDQVRESEQTRIARELHDDLGQRITAMKMSLGLLEGQLGDDQHARQTRDALTDLAGEMDGMAVALRRIASDLRPPILDDLGLEAALEWMAENFTRRYGVHATLHFDADDVAFNEVAATAIFRMTQEALTNVARHAHAKHAHVELVASGNACSLRIDDDGVGMAPDAQRKERSFGLLGVRERARLLDGDVSVDTAPGKGFRLAVSLPLAAVGPATDE